MRRFILCLLPILSLGCRGTSDDGTPVRHVIGDTIIVENGVALHRELPRLEAVARYGTFDDPGPASLGRVFALTAAPDGSVYLYDHEEGIKRFAADGSFVVWVARSGAGPGEVGHTLSLAVGPTGELAALDLGNWRVLVVPTVGDAWVVPLPDGMPRYHEDALQFGPDGRLRVGVNPPFTARGEEPSPRVAYLGLVGDSIFADTLLVPDRIWDRCRVRSEPRHRRGFWEDERQPYVAKATWASGPDGSFAIGCPDRYEFDLQRPDGTVVRIRRTGVEPVTLSREHRRFLADWAGLSGLPDERPAYARLILPGDGRVWVWPNGPGVTWTPSREIQERTGVTVAWALPSHGAFDVFESDGSWVASIPLPEEVPYSGFPTEWPVFIRGDTVWARSVDEFDVNYVTRYELRWR